MSSSDDDEFPAILNIRPESLNRRTSEQSIDALFTKSCILVRELEIEKKVQEDANKSLTCPEPEHREEDQANLECGEVETSKEDFFFIRPNHTQYFSLKDVETLKNYGYDYKQEMSSDEDIMYALEPRELHDLICTDNVCQDILNTNKFVHFLIKSLSLHHDATYIASCQRLIKSLVNKSEDISFTFEEIFQILFNCSADISTSQIFNIIKLDRLLSPVLSNEPIPEHWLSNLKAVLDSLSDILQVCEIPDEDLNQLVLCLLIMSLENESYILSEIQKCLSVVLERFLPESWPIYRLTIADTLGKVPKTDFLNGQWLYSYRMVKAIPDFSINGEQLKKYICVRVLLNLSDFNNELSTEYSEELFCLSTLAVVLNSLYQRDNNFQQVIIKFLDILTDHLKFTTEEYEQLCKQLKNAQNNFLNAKVSANSLDLEVIHTRINLSKLNIKTLKTLQKSTLKIQYVETDEEMSEDESIMSDNKTTDCHEATKKSDTVVDKVEMVEGTPCALNDNPLDFLCHSLPSVANVIHEDISEPMETNVVEPNPPVEANEEINEIEQEAFKVDSKVRISEEHPLLEGIRSYWDCSIF